MVPAVAESASAIRAFAGEDISVAKYYPQDREYLLEFEPAVVHYEVVGGGPSVDPGTGS